MRLEPKFARVLLEREKVKRTNIIVPQIAEKRNAPTIGTVVAVGPTADQGIKVGSKVLFGVHAGDWVKCPGAGDDLYICQDEDILCEIHEGA